MKTMHEARSKDELYRKIYHEPEGNIGVLRVESMHSLFIFERNTSKHICKTSLVFDII